MVICGIDVQPMNRMMLACRVLRNTDTSFLKACSCASVGFVTFSFFMATGPGGVKVGFIERALPTEAAQLAGLNHSYRARQSTLCSREGSTN